MAERKNTHGLEVTVRNGCRVIGIGSMEIWDGADLSLIRDTLTRMIVGQRQHSVGIDMSCVKYVPSGFFGMLFDWFEQGISVRLFSPQPRVANMLWFKRFFDHEDDEIYCLTGDSAEPEDFLGDDQDVEEGWPLDWSDSELSSVEY